MVGYPIDLDGDFGDYGNGQHRAQAMMDQGVSGDQVLLRLRQYTGYMDGRWVAGAGGHVEPGEMAQDCAVREVQEELGVVVEPASLIPVTVMHRTDGTESSLEQRVDWFFLTERWDGKPYPREHRKCAQLGWFDLTDLPPAMSPYERWVLEGPSCM